MGKGIFSQCFVILLSEAVTVQKIREILEPDFGIAGINESSEQWMFGGPSVLVPYRPDVNGFVIVDVVDKPWPDAMGDPEKDELLFGAWSMGHFGPFAYPGNLERAAQQSWLFPEGETIETAHKAFIRVRVSYVLGKDNNEAPILPEDYQVLPEIMMVTKLAQKLLELHGTLCLFNPNGESLIADDVLDALLDRQQDNGLFPLEAWANVRFYNLMGDENNVMMDTVGMGQLDVIDHEAIFDKTAYDANDVANFLRNMSDHVLRSGQMIENGGAAEGPGGIQWQGAMYEKSLSVPPRPVIRWFPMDDRKRPEGMEQGNHNQA